METKVYKKQLTGIITSTKMAKTVVVEVTRFTKHAKYGKFMKRHKKYKAHYEGAALKEGDRVTIEETNPISKDKRFRVI